MMEYTTEVQRNPFENDNIESWESGLPLVIWNQANISRHQTFLLPIAGVLSSCRP